MSYLLYEMPAVKGVKPVKSVKPMKPVKSVKLFNSKHGGKMEQKPAAKNGQERKDTRFKPGNPGKPKGATNLIPRTAKECFMQVFEALGGAEGLLAWVRKDKRNQATFYGFIARLLPSDLNITQEPQRPKVIIIDNALQLGPKPASEKSQEVLDAWGDDAPAHLQPLQSRNREGQV